MIIDKIIYIGRIGGRAFLLVSQFLLKESYCAFEKRCLEKSQTFLFVTNPGSHRLDIIVSVKLTFASIQSSRI